MSPDVACGLKAFVDLTFVGLDGLPGPGEERHARDYVRSAGGGAITAIGLARLEADVTLLSPIGADPDGDFLRGTLAADGVRWAGRKVARTAVTAVLPVDGERAMATFEPDEHVTRADLAATADARAIVLALPAVALAPPEATVYVTCGDAEARAAARAPVPGLERARALLVNAREAALLAGVQDAEAAARRLAERTPLVVVTLGADGALAATDADVVRVDGVAVDAVDTTGAGDLFTAAYVWADMLGAPLEERLRWAALYAALSVRVPTGTAGAATLDALAEAGAGHGLALPAAPVSVSMIRRDP